MWFASIDTASLSTYNNNKDKSYTPLVLVVPQILSYITNDINLRLLLECARSFFNAVQTEVFHTAYETNMNMIVGELLKKNPTHSQLHPRGILFVKVRPFIERIYSRGQDHIPGYP